VIGDWSAQNPLRPPVAERAKKSREELEDLLTHDLRRVEGKIKVLPRNDGPRAGKITMKNGGIRAECPGKTRIDFCESENG
jgi:hypothetical protein